MDRRTLHVITVGAALLALYPVVSLAFVTDGITNQLIDRAQPAAALWFSNIVTTLFLGFTAWLGNRIGIRVLEKFNRDAVKTAAENFANSVIDELQLRFLDADKVQPDITDLVNRGVEYVSKGSPDAIKNLPLLPYRLRQQVEGALLKKAHDFIKR